MCSRRSNVANFIEKPNLPQKKVKAVFLGEKYADELCKGLAGLQIDIFPVAACTALDSRESSHPDMLICHIGKNQIVAAPEIYDWFKGKYQRFGLEIIRGTKKLGGRYPENIAYNAAILKEHLFANLAECDASIKNSKLCHVNIKQGYAKCSICIVDENTMITEDEGIYEKAKYHGFECIKIPHGAVRIEGHDYGFIGGGTGKLAKNQLAFTGRFKDRNTYCKVFELLTSKCVDPIALTEREIFDVGSIIPIMEE